MLDVDKLKTSFNTEYSLSKQHPGVKHETDRGGFNVKRI